MTPEPAARVDLNADLGEGAPYDRDLLSVVTSASIACGVHAGDHLSMAAAITGASATGVVLGAHPSYWDRQHFGRLEVGRPATEMAPALAYQVGALAGVAALAGARVRFVKLHGALYNRAATDPEYADAVVAALSRLGQFGRGQAGPLPVLALAGSQLYHRALGAGLGAFGEAFADRAYLPDGALAPRSGAGAVLESEDAVVTQALQLATRRSVTALDGSIVPVEADSICVHGDTPGALALATAVRGALEDAGVQIMPFLPAGPGPV